MSILVERDHGRLVVRQRLVPVARYVIGVPLVLWGAAMLYGVGATLVTGIAERGIEALLVAGMGAWLLALLTALTLPLGWWLTFGRRYIVIDPQGPQVVEVTDWRLGRREKTTPASAFRAVRVAVEPLHDSPAETDAGGTTWGQQIRLLAGNPARQPSIEIGWLALEERDTAIAAAQQVAHALGLGLEVAPAEARLMSPGREQALTDIDAEIDAE